MVRKTRHLLNYFSNKIASSRFRAFLLVFAILIMLLSVSYVFAEITIESPDDGYWTSSSNDTLAFTFNMNTTNPFDGPFSCQLTLNGNPVAENSSVDNDTSTVFYSNTSFSLGVNNWVIGCTNGSHSNQTVSRMLNYDNLAPIVTLITPVNGVTVPSANPGLQFNVSDNLGSPYNCSLYIDGVYQSSNASTENATQTTLSYSFSEGAHTWNVSCTDNASNVGSAQNSITYDNTAPTAVILTQNHTWTSDTAPAITFNITDNVAGSITYQFFVDGTADLVANGSVSNASLGSDDLDTLAPGMHVLILQANDSLPNYANSSETVIYVDNVAPTVALDGPPDGMTIGSATPSLIFNVTDNLGAPYNCSLYIDGVYNMSNASTLNATNTEFPQLTFAQGTHTWNVSCTDNASNVDSARATFTYDGSAPTPVISTGNHTWFNTTSPQIGFTVTDNLANPVSYVFYVDGVANTSGTVVNNTPSSATLAGLSPGGHVIILNVNDSVPTFANTTELVIYVDASSPVVTAITPDNSNVTSAPTLQFNVSDDFGSPYNCSLYVNGVYNVSSATANATLSGLVLGASEGTYTWYVNCTDNASNWGVSSPARTVKLDLAGGPVIHSVSVNESDIFVSDNAANNHITLLVNATDSGTGVHYVTVNLTDLSGDISGADFQNMTYNAGTGLWWLVVTVTNSATYDFEAVNISMLAYDYIPQMQSAGQNHTTVVIYNMTLMPGDPAGCGNIVAGSTDFSAETDWEDVDVILLIDLNYTISCGIPSFVADNQLHRAAKFNFTGLNLTSESAFQSLGNFMSSIEINITPEGQWGDSRIYLDSSALGAFNTTSTITLYGLPFDAIPTIIGDLGTANNGTPISYVTYVDSDTNYTLGNLTFTVLGFSGYNASDTANPLITVNSPSPNTTAVQGPTPLVNITVNGTGTQVSNVSVLLDGSFYYMDDMTCYNASGSELMNCYFNPTVSDGSHTFTVYAWDYGSGSAPGNANTTSWNFTSDTSAPSVVGGQNNASGQVGLTTPVKVNVTVTDTTNVSSVKVRNVTMNSMGSGYYEVNTTAGAMGCSAGSTCVLTLNATDDWGYSNTTENASSLSIAAIPVVGGTSLNTSISTRNVTSTTTFQINVTVSGGVATNVTLYNGSLVQLTNITSSVWQADTNASALGCSAGVCSLVVNISDNLGNQDQTTVQVGVDDSRPAVASLTPSDWYVTSSAAVQLNATVTDASTIFSVYVNGTQMTSIGSDKYQAASLTMGAFSCTSGACVLLVTATDMPGNVNNTETITIMVDNANPLVTVSGKNSTLIRSNSTLQVNVTVTDSNLTSGSVYVGSGSTWVQMTSIGSNIYQANRTGTQLGCTSTGTCTLYFNATDEAGNTNTSTTTTVGVDNDGPVVSAGSVTNTTSGKAKIDTEVNIRVTVSDSPADVASVTVDGGSSVTMYLLSGTTWHTNATGTALGCSANSLCTLTFTATDNLGNVNNTVTATYTTDDAGPDNDSAFNATADASSGTVAADMNESSKCSVAYGANESSLTSSANSSSFADPMSAVISGLSASTTYYYNVTSCWDELGNSRTFTTASGNFTTSAASSGGGGGGGGGSSGGYSSTYDAGDMTGGSGEWSLGQGDGIGFQHTLNGFSESHSVSVKKVGSNYAIIVIASKPKELTIYTGQSKTVDLDDDGRDDVEVSLLDIVYNKVLLKVTSLVVVDRPVYDLLPPRPPKAKTAAEATAETVPVTTEEAAEPAPAPIAEPAPAPTPEPAPVEQKKGASYTMIFGVLVAIIAVVLVVVFLVERKRRQF